MGNDVKKPVKELVVDQVDFHSVKAGKVVPIKLNPPVVMPLSAVDEVIRCIMKQARV